jgi:polyhydroxybutyrate depolymerase
VPKGYDGEKPLPVVVMLHGGGGRGQGAARETGWNAKADEACFLAVFPDAVPSDPTKPAKFGGNPQLWNDGSGRFEAGQNGVDDIGFLRAMLDEISATFKSDSRRIYFTGFSNGASMTFRVGAELSDRVAAVAPVAGTCWNDPAGSMRRPVSLCTIAGSEDPLNPLSGGQPAFANGLRPRIGERPKPPVLDSVLKWSRAAGCPEAPTRVSTTNGVRTELRSAGTNRAEVVFITVEGLGHTWAGGASLLPETLVGKRTDKIRATDVLWEFFRKHALPE